MLHYSKAEGEIHHYRTGDAALGLTKNAEFNTNKIRFQQGDIILLFSDGLMETTNYREKEWGLEGIKGKLKDLDDELSSAEIYNALIKEASSFRGITDQSDDFTLMVIKIK